MKCFVENLICMRQAAELKPSLLTDTVIFKLWDDDFIGEVHREISKLDPICVFIDTVQAKTCTLAESAHTWLQMDFILGYNAKWINRTEMVCDLTSLVAYSLHPNYKGSRMNNLQWKRVKAEIYKKGEQTYAEFEKFLSGAENFGDEDMLKLSPDCYWKTMQYEYPFISRLALKLLPLPSSTASLERVFSMWAYVHNKSRNRLSPDLSEKLIFLYHTIKMFDEITFANLY